MRSKGTRTIKSVDDDHMVTDHPARAGLEAIAFTPDSSESLDTVRGIVLTGGTDVDPALYGETPGPETEKPDRERDDYESAILRDANESLGLT